MAKATTKLKLQVREGGVINGFSYPYCRLLLDKLKQLREEGMLVVPQDDNKFLTKIGRMTAKALHDQLGFVSTDMTRDFSDFREFLVLAEEFLSTFED